MSILANTLLLLALSLTTSWGQGEALAANVLVEDDDSLSFPSKQADHHHHHHYLRGLVQDRPSCPDQEPCMDLGDGWYAYHIFQSNQTDGTCVQRCAGGTYLTDYLSGDYECGTCVWASCPGQEPCMDYGNGFLGYSIYQLMSQNDGSSSSSCLERCTAGNLLAQYLYSGNYTCGTCANALNSSSSSSYDPKDDPKCPNQTEPCRIFGDGYKGYHVFKFNETDGTCQQACAASQSLRDLLDDEGYECGWCDPPSCPDQEPCANLNGIPAGYSLYNITSDGTCHQVCATGNSLAGYLANPDWTCGTCSIAFNYSQPSCPNQEEPCRIFDGGLKGYSVHKVNTTDGTCSGYCAGGTSLTNLLDNHGYVCGPCVYPTCPDQQDEPCANFTNGLLGYSLYNVTSDGTCRQVCAGGNSLAEFLFGGEYVCGVCS